MLKALKLYFSKPMTIVGIITALMFQIIFSVIWMTAYSGVTERSSNLKIAIVNEDQNVGKTIANELEGSLPFQIVTGLTAEEAQKRLNDREMQMVMEIPADFTARLTSPVEKAEIRYTINEANPMTIKSIMQGVEQKVTATINSQAAVEGTTAALVQANMPEAAAEQTAGALTEKVESQVTSIHPVNGMNNQMVPMMMVLATFVGSMIMGLNIQQSTMALGNQVGKWSKYGARVLINVGTALVVSFVGTVLINILGGQMEQGFGLMWLYEGLLMLTFMFFTQMFLIVFGMPGMFFNITMLSIQLVSSGAMVPREMLNGFYQHIGAFLPATYAVNGIMSLQLGGPGAGHAAGVLALILLVCMGVALLATALKRKPAVAPAVVPKTT
ncbi:YhgE/Pip domain-containing protein [Paenibacillus medicaginis]|uniref:YhgE/Pip domain-containing protein n=1 Tax=Paenibacillus medicaginis TaxID=1470560 RepID=A0ABV5C469_9BACL